jgi:hypothetical protein
MTSDNMTSDNVLLAPQIFRYGIDREPEWFVEYLRSIEEPEDAGLPLNRGDYILREENGNIREIPPIPCSNRYGSNQYLRINGLTMNLSNVGEYAYGYRVDHLEIYTQNQFKGGLEIEEIIMLIYSLVKADSDNTKFMVHEQITPSNDERKLQDEIILHNLHNIMKVYALRKLTERKETK